MSIAISRDLRERSVQAVNDGMAPSEIARIFQISIRSLRRWRHLEATTGDLTPRPHPGRPSKLSAEQRTAVHEHVRQHPDATLADRVAWLAATHDVQVSVATMSRLMKRLGLTFKKRV